MEYQARVVDRLLDELFPHLPAILLDGPKAVGKTTTAAQRAKTVRNLDNPAQSFLAESAPASLLAGETPILLDEWQRVPAIWDEVKRSIDEDFVGGKYLLTGSMPDASTHSGAGRIATIRMRPLSVAERHINQTTVSLGALLRGEKTPEGECGLDFEDYLGELMRSGFPAIRKLSGRPLKAALDGYLERVIDYDLREVGLSPRKPATLKSWLTAYAAATGTTASWETIRDAAGAGNKDTPAKSTVLPYRDALTRLRILDELPAWLPTKNRLKRVAQGSKHFLADPSLAMRLLNVDGETALASLGTEDQFSDRPLIGRLFEALSILSIRTYAEANFAKTMHLRDTDGHHEVDVIIEREDGKIFAIEIKLAPQIKDSDFKQLHWLADQIGSDFIGGAVVYSGRFAFQRNGMSVIPLGLLGM